MNFVSPHVREEDVLVEQAIERSSSVGQTFDVILVERDEAVETQQISRGLGDVHVDNGLNLLWIGTAST